MESGDFPKQKHNKLSFSVSLLRLQLQLFFL